MADQHSRHPLYQLLDIWAQRTVARIRRNQNSFVNGPDDEQRRATHERPRRFDENKGSDAVRSLNEQNLENK